MLTTEYCTLAIIAVGFLVVLWLLGVGLMVLNKRVSDEETKSKLMFSKLLKEVNEKFKTLDDLSAMFSEMQEDVADFKKSVTKSVGKINKNKTATLFEKDSK